MGLPADELRRLREGPRPGEPEPGIGGYTEIEVLADRPEMVLGRTRAALELVGRGLDEGWQDARWVEELPGWFVAGLSSSWTLPGWLWWFEDDQRYWWWWDARVTGPDRFWIRVAMADLPFPWEALRMLLLAAGATDARDVA